MKKEYDFRKGERSKFFKSKAHMHMPIYLAPDIEAFVRQEAEKRHMEVDAIVNELLRKEIENI